MKSNEEFLNSLPEKRNQNFIRVDARIRGELKNKVITDLQKGTSIQKHTVEVFRFYYDNHPNKMTY